MVSNEDAAHAAQIRPSDHPSDHEVRTEGGGRGGSLQRALAEGSLLKQPVGLEHHGGVPECGAVLCAAQADKTFCNGPAVSIGNCADYDGARSIGERQ